MHMHAESVHTGEQERLRQLEKECLAGMRCFIRKMQVFWRVVGVQLGDLGGSILATTPGIGN